MYIMICDDIEAEARHLEKLLRASGFPADTAVFLSGYDALRYANTGASIDVCFLDIVMPEMSGVELAHELREDGYAGEIVFLSTSNEYGSESYGVGAFTYLLKPATPETVGAVLGRLADKLAGADHAGIPLKMPGIAKTLLFKDLSHVEVVQHTVRFTLADGSVVPQYMSLREVAGKLLSDKRFVQTHRSYIVNMEHVSELTETAIIMRGGARIPVTRTFRGVRGKYYRWAFSPPLQ
jgi:DNA-binding LytR/AlgR family response regulator